MDSNSIIRLNRQSRIDNKGAVLKESFIFGCQVFGICLFSRGERATSSRRELQPAFVSILG
jgi:hypothetical protein